ncbi:hypothetical protein BZA70DRAFT_297200 [Myxozyma melibiosi]|uniref:HSF-type DNA-binding domain-containing protein n=1 Tax=Myxozyma melibiosi TaxID=54550 RepID=A0ABR1F0Q3_9ASCO
MAACGREPAALSDQAGSDTPLPFTTRASTRSIATAGSELSASLFKAPPSALKQRPALTSGPTVPGSITAPVTSSNPVTSTTTTSSSSRKPAKSRKAITSAPKTRPAFVLKLWTMVNDPVNAAHISWMPDGTSFQVVGREQFERTVLPRYFKHSNFSSFVRQLNMYGWHKVQDVTAGAMHSGEETWQFHSPNFIRGREDLLDNIVRNRGSKGSEDEDEPDLHQLLEEVEIIRQSQQAVAEQLKQIKQDNELLWRESYQTRERHQSFSETLEKILRFLASVYGNPSKILGDSAASTTTIVPVGSPVPSNRNRLMLRDVAEPHILELSADSPTVSKSPMQSSTPFVTPAPSTSQSSTSVPYNAPTPNSARTMIEQSDFLDMIPMENRTPATGANGRSFFPDLLASTPISGPAMSPALSAISDGARQLVNNLGPRSPPVSMSKIVNNSNSLDDLQTELDLQGQSLDQVQEWISKNLSTYDNNNGISQSSPDDSPIGSNSTSNEPTPSMQHLEELPAPVGIANGGGFDVGDFLASPGPTSFYNDDDLAAQYPDDLMKPDLATVHELPAEDGVQAKRRRLSRRR